MFPVRVRRAVGAVLSAAVLFSLPLFAQSSSAASSAPGHSTCPIRTAPLSPGDQAMTHDDYAKAVDLYRAESKASGTEGQRAHTAMIRAMLRSDRIKDADTEARAWAAAEPRNVWAQIALGEVEWREGDLSAAIATMQKASVIDGCTAQVHADFAEVERLSGLRASAERQLTLAHELDPIDNDIEGAWMHLQPRSVQLQDLTGYLQRNTSLSGNERKFLEHMRENLAQPPVQPCRLSTPVAGTSIPYRAIQDGANAPVIWGLDVSFNGKPRRLMIDTGASGLLLTSSAATALHLVPDERIKSWGIGDQGAVDSYIANVKSIKIGGLVFEDCDVTVLGKPPANADGFETMEAEDGLIGGDVFEDFLLTLDFPGHMLKLDPLPPIPNTAAVAPTLQTGVQSDRPARDRYIAPSMASWTRVFRSGHDLLIPVHLNGGPPHLFIVDTGSQLNLISPQAAREVAKVSSGSDTDIYGISGKVDKTYTTGPLKVQFANLIQPSTGMTAIDTSSLGRSIGVDIAGFLGAPTLHQLIMQVDYRDDLINFTFDPKRLSRCVEGLNIADCY